MDIPKAADMRARLNAAQSDAAQRQLAILIEQIRGATTAGRSSISVLSFEPGVKQQLEQAGYTVMYYPGDQRDQRDPSYHSVSW